MQVILDFCGTCGILLEEGVGNEKEPQCHNCNASVAKREQRAQGVFSEEDAQKMRNPTS